MDDTTTTTTSGTDPAVIKALKEERKGLRAELKQGVSSEREKRIGKRILQINYQIAKENLKDKPPEVKEKLKKQNLERAKRSINNKLQKANMKAPPVSIIRAKKKVRHTQTHLQKLYKNCHCSDHNPNTVVAFILIVPT